MNAKWIQKTLLGITLVSALNSWAADPHISDVTVRQRWPWSRLVDIDYVLSCDSSQRVDVLVQAYNGTTALTLPENSLSGDRFGLTYGAHHIVWDPTLTSSENNGVLPEFRVELTPIAPPVYMIVDLTKDAGVEGQIEYVYPGDARLETVGRWTNVWFGVTNNAVYATTKLVLRRVPAGSFGMGDTSLPTTLTQDFYIGVFEVTQRQWQLITSAKPSYFNNTTYYASRPLEQRSYEAIRGTASGTPSISWPATGRTVAPTSFLGLLRTKTALNNLDLPTDAQWEYACRAGTTSVFNDGDATANVTGENALTNVWLNALGRYRYDGGYVNGSAAPAQGCAPVNGTAVVGSYQPNGWGLYDMHGNVVEWCLDWLGTRTGGSDPSGPTSGSSRIKRGGAYNSSPDSCRSAYLGFGTPNDSNGPSGLRLVRPLE